MTAASGERVASLPIGPVAPLARKLDAALATVAGISLYCARLWAPYHEPSARLAGV